MSRGPGRIERAIRSLFDAHPDDAFIIEELAKHCYPDACWIEHKHFVAVRRALFNVIRFDAPDWDGESLGPRPRLIYFNRASAMSRARVGEWRAWAEAYGDGYAIGVRRLSDPGPSPEPTEQEHRDARDYIANQQQRQRQSFPGKNRSEQHQAWDALVDRAVKALLPAFGPVPP